MIAFAPKSYVYIDYETLQDEAMEGLLALFASKHMQMRLCVKDAWELEEAKHLDTYGYICDVVYGEDILSALVRYAKAKNSARNIFYYSHNKRLIFTRWMILVLSLWERRENMKIYKVFYR